MMLYLKETPKQVFYPYAVKSLTNSTEGINLTYRFIQVYFTLYLKKIKQETGSKCLENENTGSAVTEM